MKNKTVSVALLILTGSILAANDAQTLNPPESRAKDGEHGRAGKNGQNGEDGGNGGNSETGRGGDGGNGGDAE